MGIKKNDRVVTPKGNHGRVISDPGTTMAYVLVDNPGRGPKGHVVGESVCWSKLDKE